MEQITAYLAPCLVSDRGTPAYRAILARATRLRRNYPEDVAIRFVQWDLDHYRGGLLSRRDLRAVGWLILHPDVLARLTQQEGRWLA